MADDSFYDDLISNKKDKEKLLDNLYTIPRKDKGLNIAHYQSKNKNIINQADILYLPNDGGYKFFF